VKERRFSAAPNPHHFNRASARYIATLSGVRDRQVHDSKDFAKWGGGGYPLHKSKLAAVTVAAAHSPTIRRNKMGTATTPLCQHQMNNARSVDVPR